MNITINKKLGQSLIQSSMWTMGLTFLFIIFSWKGNRVLEIFIALPFLFGLELVKQ